MPSIVQFFWIVLILSVCSSFSNSISVSLKQRRQRRNSEVVVQGLYNSSDEVEELTSQNFNQRIYGSERAWLVEFYNTWCGHCQRYAPTYKGVAEYFKSAKDIFVIAAVDCADEINQPLCRNFEIMSYPSLSYFHENYSEGPRNLGQTIRKGDVDDIDGNIKIVIDTLISEQKENRALMLPSLLPYENNDISRIFDSTKPEVQFAFLILENDKSLLGVKAALNFHKVTNIFITYSLKSNIHLASSLNIDKLPALIILSHGTNEPKIEEKIPRIDYPERHIAAFLKQKGFNVDQYFPSHDNKNTINVDPNKDFQELEQQELINKVKEMGDVVFQMDLETALRSSLRQEVSRTKLIEGEKLNALRIYLKILVKYFPLGKRGHFFLNDLLNIVTNSDSVRGAEISALIKNSEREGQLIWSSPKGWIGCKGSTPESRGYPCGVWTLFHYLTVNALEQNTGRMNADPKEVLMAMHGYIKNFFGCADCAQHFQKMSTDKRIEQVSSFPKAVMWLWEAHNVVNKRLAGDPTEDPQYPKKEFPTVERCPECRLSNGSWNEDNVLKYLKHVYGSINVRYIGSDTKILHMGLEGSFNHTSSVLGSIDSNVKKQLDTFTVAAKQRNEQESKEASTQPSDHVI